MSEIVFGAVSALMVADASSLLASLLVLIIFICLAIILNALRSSLKNSAARAKTVDPMMQMMAHSCLAFLKFLQEIDRTPRYRKELEETPGLERLDEEDDGNLALSLKLLFIVYCDLRDVYTRLGHNVRSLHNREGIGFAMMMVLMVNRDTDLSLMFGNSIGLNNSLNIAEKHTCKDIGELNAEGYEDELRFAIIFGRIHHEHDLVNRYAALLYRWASLIAKANGSISPKESAVLKSIMELRTNETMRFSGDICVVGGEKRPMVEKREYGDVQTTRTSYPTEKSTGGLNSLKSLIGLESVKNEVRQLANFIEIQQKRKKAGLCVAPVSYHCVFTGNPGTGKTTVARILAEIYRDMGIVEKGHLVETDRSGLVGEYVGQTAVKTNKIIDSALGGVLFIDEAYSLLQGVENDYGREAIATLLKRMEDDRKHLVVILAGYTNEMKKFIDSNPGLQSRFSRFIEFPDYSAEELAQIFLNKAKECQYVCNADVQASLVDIMRRAIECKDRNFGNGRFVRNLFESAIQRQATRLSSKSPLTSEMLSELTLHDLGFAYED